MEPNDPPGIANVSKPLFAANHEEHAMKHAMKKAYLVSMTALIGCSSPEDHESLAASTQDESIATPAFSTMTFTDFTTALVPVRLPGGTFLFPQGHSSSFTINTTRTSTCTLQPGTLGTNCPGYPCTYRSASLAPTSPETCLKYCESAGMAGHCAYSSLNSACNFYPAASPGLQPTLMLGAGYSENGHAIAGTCQ